MLTRLPIALLVVMVPLALATSCDYAGPRFVETTLPDDPEAGVGPYTILSVIDGDVAVQEVSLISWDPWARQTRQPMTLSGDGVWEGNIAAAGPGTRLHFFVEATDLRGNSRRDPVEADSWVYTFRVAGGLYELEPQPLPSCLEQPCPEGQFCDPASGQCIDQPEPPPPCQPESCPEGLRCDTSSGQCVNTPPPPPTCQPGDCPDGQRCETSSGQCVDDPPPPIICRPGGCPDGQHCDLDSSECVDGPPSCLAVSCIAGENCDPQLNACVPDSPLCQGCTAHAQCGGPNDLCIRISGAGGGSLEICGRGCSNTRPCPPNYDCEENDLWTQCVPASFTCD